MYLYIYNDLIISYNSYMSGTTYNGIEKYLQLQFLPYAYRSNNFIYSLCFGDS